MAVSWSRVMVSVVPAWLMGKAMKSTLPQYLLRAAKRGEFIDAYLGSIKKARGMITGQWIECIWDKKNIDIHPQVTSDMVFHPHIP